MLLCIFVAIASSGLLYIFYSPYIATCSSWFLFLIPYRSHCHCLHCPLAAGTDAATTACDAIAILCISCLCWLSFCCPHLPVDCCFPQLQSLSPLTTIFWKLCSVCWSSIDFFVCKPWFAIKFNPWPWCLSPIFCFGCIYSSTSKMLHPAKVELFLSKMHGWLHNDNPIISNLQDGTFCYCLAGRPDKWHNESPNKLAGYRILLNISTKYTYRSTYVLPAG